MISYKHSNLAELLYANYSGLQMMAFAFSKKTRYSGRFFVYRSPDNEVYGICNFAECHG